MKFSLTAENHKNKTTCADTFHICISLHILTQGIFYPQKKSVSSLFFIQHTNFDFHCKNRT